MTTSIKTPYALITEANTDTDLWLAVKRSDPHGDALADAIGTADPTTVARLIMALVLKGSNLAAAHKMNMDIDLLRYDGYKPTGPGGEAESIDCEVCEESTCHICGHQGLQYHPWTHPKGGYRAFTVCSHCGEWGEF